MLSKGAIMTLCTGGIVVNPVFQILKITKTPDTYHIIISDGPHTFDRVKLHSRLYWMVKTNELNQFCIVKINHNLVKKTTDEKEMIVLLDITVVNSLINKRISNLEISDVNGRTGPSALAIQPHCSSSEATDGLNSNRSQVPPSLMGLGEGVKILPITTLTSSTKQWVIKVTVLTKSPYRDFCNYRALLRNFMDTGKVGNGNENRRWKCFRMMLADETGEVEAVAYNDQCEKFYDIIEVGNVYYISGGNVLRDKFMPLYEESCRLIFTDNTQVVKSTTECHNKFKLECRIVKLHKLLDRKPGFFADVIGICKSASDLQTHISRRTNREIKWRKVTLVEPSLTAITVTVFGHKAEEVDASTNPVIAIKCALVTGSPGFRLVRLFSCTEVHINPDLEESRELREWFDNCSQESNQTFNDISVKQDGEVSDDTWSLTPEEHAWRGW